MENDEMESLTFSHNRRRAYKTVYVDRQPVLQVVSGETGDIDDTSIDNGVSWAPGPAENFHNSNRDIPPVLLEFGSKIDHLLFPLLTG